MSSPIPAIAQDPARSSSVPARSSSCGASVAAVTTHLLPYDYWHDRYQAYYAEGIRLALDESGGRFERASLSRAPGALRRLRRVRDSSRIASKLKAATAMFQRSVDAAARVIGGRALPPSGFFHPLVGQYVFHMADRTRRNVCIDAQDSGDLASPQLLGWSDLYFKTNYWAGRDYDRKVVPLCNGNPLLLDKLDRLRSLRDRTPAYDLCFIVRVWGGADEVEGIEHNLRLIEAAAKVPCRKYLLAYLVAGDVQRYAKRLEAQGIPWRTAPLPLDELWRISAESRLNVIRLGMHFCVPWRMADMLAMAACPVLDQPPFTTWPEPLREGENYLHLGVAAGPGRATAGEEQYAAIPERLQQFLANETLVYHVRESNTAYFETHFAPLAVGRYVCRMVAELGR